MLKIFLDTNFLIYCVDHYNPKRQNKGLTQFKTLHDCNAAVVSTQVLQEFFVAATKKIGIPALRAKELMRMFENLEIVVITPDLIKEAIDCSLLNQISYWDALILVAAEISIFMWVVLN